MWRRLTSTRYRFQFEICEGLELHRRPYLLLRLIRGIRKCTTDCWFYHDHTMPVVQPSRCCLPERRHPAIHLRPFKMPVHVHLPPSAAYAILNMLKLAVGRTMAHHDVELSSIAEHAHDSSPDSGAPSKRAARLKPKRVMFDEAPARSYEHNIAAIIRLQRFIRVGAQYDLQTSMLFLLTSLVFHETNISSNPYT